MELRGKTVLITGAARRIGREIALTLAESGASIVVHYSRSSVQAGRLKREVEARGVSAVTVRADFSDAGGTSARVRAFARAVFKEVPRIDVLVNNASIFFPTPLGKIKDKAWDDFMSVNLKAPFFLAQEFGGRMLAQKSGKIINLTDWIWERPDTNYLPYAISKAGLNAATLGLARALAPHVQVNAIAPGPILPPAGTSPERRAKVTQRTLLKRFGTPRDIADAVKFLIESDYLTGAVIPVEGGARLS